MHDASRRTELVLEFIGHLYDTVLDPGASQPAIDSLKVLLGGCAAQVATYDRATGEVLRADMDSDEANRRPNELYVAEWGRRDPRPRLLPSGTVARCHEYFDEKFVASNDYYQEFFIPNGYRWALGGMVHHADGTSTIVANLRPPDAPPYEAQTARLLESLLPHFTRVSRLRQQLRTSQGPEPDLVRLVQHLPTACLILDDAGRVLAHNAAGLAMLSEMPIGMVGTALRFVAPRMQAAWQQALSSVWATRAPASIRIDGSPDAHWAVQLVPWTLLSRPADARELRLCLATIEHHGGPSRRQIEVFAASVKLSRAETEVLELILQGRVTKQIAAARGSSLNTVRSQITSILIKSGARKQRDLGSLVLRAQ